MITAGIAEKIRQHWRITERLAAACFFAIEQTQWVAVQTGMTILAQLSQPALCKYAQALAVAWAAYCISERIHVNDDIELQRGKEIVQHEQQLGIDQRVVTSENLGADLVKLAISAFLRPLAPEHGTDIEQLGDRFLVRQAVLDIGPDHRSSPLRP